MPRVRCRAWAGRLSWAHRHRKDHRRAEPGGEQFTGLPLHDRDLDVSLRADECDGRARRGSTIGADDRRDFVRAHPEPAGGRKPRQERRGEARDQIAEGVDVDDFAADLRGGFLGLGPAEPGEIGDGGPERFRRLVVEKPNCGGSQHIPAMKRRRGVGRHGDRAGGTLRKPSQGQREQAVVGAEKLLGADPRPDEPTARAHAWIDDDDVQRVGGKGEAGLADEPGCPTDVVRGHVVRDVDECE